jgi:thiosulfate dehydrogenase [quinone] large subunit
MAESPGVLAFVDFVNIWGQIFIWLGLMLGLFTRIAAIGGAVLLGMYYLANPPFVTSGYGAGLEGHYLFIDKNFIECIALIAIALLPTGHYLGLDKLLSGFIYRKQSARKIVMPVNIEKSKLEPQPVAEPSLPRREILKHLVTLPV